MLIAIGSALQPNERISIIVSGGDDEVLDD